MIAVVCRRLAAADVARGHRTVKKTFVKAPERRHLVFLKPFCVVSNCRKITEWALRSCQQAATQLLTSVASLGYKKAKSLTPALRSWWQAVDSICPASGNRSCPQGYRRTPASRSWLRAARVYYFSPLVDAESLLLPATVAWPTVVSAASAKLAAGCQSGSVTSAAVR